MDYRVISIGTLSRNEFWDEPAGMRTAHATTTLIRSGKKVIVVDPGLPGQAIAARLGERAGIPPEAVTDVFLTNFRPAHRRGIEAFGGATWHLFETEREVVGRSLVERYQQEEDEELRGIIEREIALLKRCQAAPEKLAANVDLFPLPGYTPGNCGLLLLSANSTTLVAGDAIPTVEHLERGQVLRGGYDIEQAQESLKEALEIADVIIPGHDNVVLNPVRRGM
ncbi:MAG: MBL fold metallo-hydrolase [Phycisphaeraceae bacterium]|nr:MBL fold metallo-hydrolase [Phycisphaeraceae bacterium]